MLETPQPHSLTLQVLADYFCYAGQHEKKSQFSPLQSGKKSMTKTKTATVNQNSKLVFAHINCFL